MLLLLLMKQMCKNFDINNFMDKLRENELLKVIPLDPNGNIPKKTKKKIKKRLVLEPAIEEDIPILEEKVQEQIEQIEQPEQPEQPEQEKTLPVSKKKNPDVDKEKIGELPQDDIIIGNDGISQRMPPNEKNK